VEGDAGGTWTTNSNLDQNGHLIPPQPALGVQIAAPAVHLGTGAEAFYCYHTDAGSSAELDVGEWESLLGSGVVSLDVYRTEGDSTPSGTMTNTGCTSGFGGPIWLYASYVRHGHLAMPGGVAVPLKAHERLEFNLHFLNTLSAPVDTEVALNAYKTPSKTFQVASVQLSFNTQIAIPPNGSQNVTGVCTPPNGASYFYMTTHTFKRGIDARITRRAADGTLGEVLVDTTDFSMPAESTWTAGHFLTFAAGEKYQYRCSYQNDRASTVTVGDSAENNEQCTTMAYYFPAGSNPPTCN
jgi:hypothetical protein